MEELVDDVFDIKPFGVSVEVCEKSVAHDGECKVSYVGAGYVDASVHEGFGFCAEDEVLSGAGSAAAGDEILDEVDGTFVAGAGCADEARGVFDDVV